MNKLFVIMMVSLLVGCGDNSALANLTVSLMKGCNEIGDTLTLEVHMSEWGDSMTTTCVSIGQGKTEEEKYDVD